MLGNVEEGVAVAEREIVGGGSYGGRGGLRG